MSLIADQIPRRTREAPVRITCLPSCLIGFDSPRGTGSTYGRSRPLALLVRFLVDAAGGRTSCCGHKAAPLSADDPGVTYLVEAVSGTTLTPSGRVKA